MFYKEVIQAILLYGLETWVLSSEMEKKVEGAHAGFLRGITGKRAWRIGYGTWEMPVADVVQKANGKQSEMTYIGRQKATVAQGVELQPIFEVCAGEKVYEGGGRSREAWWRQEATDKQLWATLVGVSRESKRRRRLGESVVQ